MSVRRFFYWSHLEELLRALVLLVASSGAIFAAEIAPPAKSLGRPLPPQEAAGHMTLPEGFKATLFAGEPNVAQPIAFTTDDRGRLWVAECYSYPKWSDAGHDRLLIFGDKHQTGHFDERKVFCDDANNLTGVELGFGGVWTCMAPRLVFTPTAGGEPGGTGQRGRSVLADSPTGPVQTMLDGWSVKGQHNIVNGLIWGPDGWLYGLHGIQAPSLIGKPDAPPAKRQAMSCGVWRYHPTRHVFEVVANGTTNPWGLDYDDYGQMFITNCVIGHLWHVVPGAHYKRMYGVDEDPYSFELIDATSDHLHWGGGDWKNARGQQSEAGGGHAHAGAMVYLGDNWPDRYRNSIFMCNLHGNRVNNDLLQRQGSGYVGRHGKDFLLANDVWFRGLNLKTGPDGGVYLSDWCDNGECHNVQQTDRASGRMYKIIYEKPNPITADLDLAKLSDADLVKLQMHKNDWYVRHARRLLQERAAEGRDMTAVHAALVAMFQNAHPGNLPGGEGGTGSAYTVPQKLRALWALYVTYGAGPDFLLRQLRHESADVRAWSIRLLVDDKSKTLSAEAQREFARLAADDPSAFVRLHLASATQRLPVDARWPIAAALAAHGEDINDHDLPLMVWYGIEPAVAAAPGRGLDFAAACKFPNVRRFVARRIALLPTTKGATSPTSQIVRFVAGLKDPSLQLDLLAGMRDALRGRHQEPLPEGWSDLRGALARSSQPELEAEADRLALIFGDRAAMDVLRQTASDRKAEPARRQRALASLVQARAPGMVELLQSLLDDPATRSSAVQGLAAYDDPRTPELLLSRYDKLSPDQRREAIDTLVARPDYALALLAAIEAKKIPASALTITHARHLEQFKSQQIDAKLKSAWGELRDTPADKQRQIDQYKAFLTPEFIAAGNPSAGRRVFEQTCAKCHSLYGVGGKIGPDLTGSNRHNVDYVVRKVVDPSAAVTNDYRMQVALLKDGRLITGILRDRTPQTVVIQTATEQIAISTDDIDELKSSKGSLMPERQLDAMTREQIRDLFSYLDSKTQPPLPVVGK